MNRDAMRDIPRCSFFRREIQRGRRPTTKFSDRTLSYQHAGAHDLFEHNAPLARGEALYVSWIAATPITVGGTAKPFSAQRMCRT